MHDIGKAALMAICFLLIPAGCAHTQLARNVERQAITISDIQEQQVLDNVAMFCTNQGAMPFFAVPTGGGTAVDQSAGAALELTWTPSALMEEFLGINAGQNNSHSWTLTPVNDPVRLKLMKCVYQKVTRGSVDDCSTCSTMLNNYFGAEHVEECTPSYWFHVGKKAPCADDCCVKVGEHCGTFVWVERRQFECLSRVTLAILDIATSDSTRLARVRGTKPDTVKIEQSFVRANGDGIKATFELDQDKFKALQEEKRGAVNAMQPLPRRQPGILEGLTPEWMRGLGANSGDGLESNLVTPESVPPIEPAPRALDAGAHIQGNPGTSLDQLILRQGNR